MLKKIKIFIYNKMINDLMKIRFIIKIFIIYVVLYL